MHSFIISATCSVQNIITKEKHSVFNELRLWYQFHHIAHCIIYEFNKRFSLFFFYWTNISGEIILTVQMNHLMTRVKWFSSSCQRCTRPQTAQETNILKKTFSGLIIEYTHRNTHAISQINVYKCHIPSVITRNTLHLSLQLHYYLRLGATNKEDGRVKMLCDEKQIIKYICIFSIQCI